MWKSIFGYVITTVIAPLVSYFVGKHTSMELGATVGGGVAGIGARVLHTTEPPAKK